MLPSEVRDVRPWSFAQLFESDVEADGGDWLVVRSVSGHYARTLVSWFTRRRGDGWEGGVVPIEMLSRRPTAEFEFSAKFPLMWISPGSGFAYLSVFKRV